MKDKFVVYFMGGPLDLQKQVQEKAPLPVMVAREERSDNIEPKLHAYHTKRVGRLGGRDVYAALYLLG